MSKYSGTLSIVSNQSSLNGHILLKAGIPDMAQAMFAATQFLVKIRHLNSGQFIQVTGEQAIGLNAIVMRDAQASLMNTQDEVFGLNTEAAETELMAAFVDANAVSVVGRKPRKRNSKTK